MAAVLDLPVFTKAHKPVAGPAFPVAGGAEGRDEAHFHEPADHLVQGALVGHVKLLRIVGPFLLGVSADGSAGSAADLGNAHLKGAAPHCLGFPGGNDHAGIGHGDADAGDDL